MAEEKNTMTNEEYIKKMYADDLKQTEGNLEDQYNQGVENLDYQKQENEKAADAALGRTYVEAQKAAKNYAEVQNAYGLTSGAMAQARMAQDNQLQADMTAIRTAQQEADAQIERERSLLSQQYTAAINEARTKNDMALAQALYEDAKATDAALFAKQEEIAKMLAEAGDYSMLQALYGLTDSQVGTLNGTGTVGGNNIKGPAFIYGIAQPGALPQENKYGNNDARPTEVGYQVPAAQPGEEYGVKPSTLEEIGYGGLPEDAIGELVRNGYLEEVNDQGVISWRIGPNGRDANGDPLTPEQALKEIVMKNSKGG